MNDSNLKNNLIKQQGSASACAGRDGFTLIEILVVIGMIAILASVVLIAINPARQFAQARNSQRVSNINAILNAVGQNLAENKGVFTCNAGVLPLSTTLIASGSGSYDIASCLVPTYLPALPYDPNMTGAHYSSNNDYNSGYAISTDSNNRITVSAPGAELEQSLSVTR